VTAAVSASLRRPTSFAPPTRPEHLDDFMTATKKPSDAFYRRFASGGSFSGEPYTDNSAEMERAEQADDRKNRAAARTRILAYVDTRPKLMCAAWNKKL
jgi:hypothetical protein